MADQVTEDNGLLQFLRDQNQIEVYNEGGRTIVERFIYNPTGNSSAQWFEGFDTFTPPTSYEILDGAEYQWRQLGALVTVSSREEKINRGEQQQVSLIKTRIQHAQAILTNTLATSLYSDGTTAKAIAGLRSLVADDPTTSASVGGINQATYSWWRNYYSAAAATTAANIVGRMNLAWLGIKRGKDVPTVWIGDDTMFGLYEESLQGLQRITDAKMADAGYQSYRYKGKPVIYDDQCPDKHLYAINTNDIKLRKMDDEMFDVGDSVQVANAMYRVVPISMMGQLTTRRRASHGVIIAS
jgi:hypothetical protein